jgi:hypothetical protein
MFAAPKRKLLCTIHCSGYKRLERFDLIFLLARAEHLFNRLEGGG